MKKAGLGEQLSSGIDAVREALENDVRVIVERGGPAAVLPLRDRFAVPLSRIGAQLEELGGPPQRLTKLCFNLAVIGRFSTGKSTLLSAIAGGMLSGQDAPGGLLPEADSPCTAIPTHLMQGAHGLRIHLVGKPTPGSLNHSLRQEISHEQLKAMHLHPAEDDGAEPFPDVSRIEIEGVLPENLRNVVLIDTLGADDRPAHTARTLDEADKADAIIAVFRDDMGNIATPDELGFLGRAAPPRAQGGKKVFHVINQFVPHRLDEDDAAYLWDLLLAEPGRAAPYDGEDLASGDIFVVNGKMAKDARLKEDDTKLALSGLPEFETRLAEFLLSHGLKMKLEPVLGDLVEAGVDVLAVVRADIRRMRNRRVNAETTAQAVARPVRDLLDTLDDLTGQTAHTADSIRSQIQLSFETAMMSSVHDVRAALDERELTALKTWAGKMRHLVWKKTATSEVQALLVGAVQSKMAHWASDSNDLTNPVRIFDTEQQALIEIIAKRLAEIDIALDHASRTLMGDESGAAADALRAKVSGWRAKLETSLKDAIAGQIEGLDFSGEYFAAAFGAAVMAGLANIGLVPVAQVALTKIAIAMGALHTTAIGVASVVALPLTAVATVAGALFMNRNAEARLKQKTLQEFSAQMSKATTAAWQAFDQGLTTTLRGAQDKFDAQIADVGTATRLELESILREATADLDTLVRLIEAREDDSEAIEASIGRLRDRLEAKAEVADETDQ